MPTRQICVLNGRAISRSVSASKRHSAQSGDAAALRPDERIARRGGHRGARAATTVAEAVCGWRTAGGLMTRRVRISHLARHDRAEVD
jgi:hypothetical protein